MLFEKTEQVHPVYLKWKCIDNFRKMDKNKMFFSGRYSPSTSMIETLTPIFEDIKKRYTKQINDLFFKPKRYLNICGGQYTFFFILPKMLKYIATKYPFFSVHLILDEIRPDNIDDYDYDFVASVIYTSTDGKIDKKFIKKVKNKKYYTSKQTYDDRMLLASSKTALDKYFNHDNIIKNHEILFGRFIEETNRYYDHYISPKHRSNDNPKIVVDSYFMLYLLMIHNIGMYVVFSSMSKMEIGSLIKLQQEPLVITRRLAFSNKNQSFPINLSQIFFKFLRNEGT